MPSIAAGRCEGDRASDARRTYRAAYPAGMRIACISLGLVALSTSATAEAIVQFPRGTLYEAARASLAALDWSAAGPPRERESGCSVGREAVCARYPEALACSNTGLGRCSFLWLKNGRLVRVETLGLDPTELVVDRTVCILNC